MKIGILEPLDFSVEAISRLKLIGNVELFDSAKSVMAFVKNKDVLFVRLGISINKELISKANHLKFICSPTTGLNHIDISLCEKKGIKIISLKDEVRFLEKIRATPEHTMGLILSLKRNYRSAFLNSKNTEWNRDSNKGFEVFGSKVGIIGLGRVGNILSKYLIAFGANVAYCDIIKKKKSNTLKNMQSMESLIKWSDTIVLCASYAPNNGIILDASLIDLLKNKYFINTARAELVDEKHLAKRANEGFFKGLAVDVILDEQGLRPNLNKLLKSTIKNNVIVTPHIGGATYSSMEKTELFIVKKLQNSINE